MAIEQLDTILEILEASRHILTACSSPMTQMKMENSLEYNEIYYIEREIVDIEVALKELFNEVENKRVELQEREDDMRSEE